MNVEKFTGPGSTQFRRQFWDSVADLVSSLTKQAGKNVTVDEIIGEHTVINVDRDTGTPSGATGACCIDGECSITTESDCTESGGIYQGDGTDCDPNPCEGCHSLTTCTVDFSFSYQDSPTPPIGHAFSGTGSISFDVSDCDGTGSGSVFVTVIEHGEFGDTTCEPDARVDLSATATYDSMTGLWSVTAEVIMLDHSTVCGPTGFPASSILSDVSDTLTDSGGVLDLVPETVPEMTGTAAFSFS